jgi:hypothetical protein
MDFVSSSKVQKLIHDSSLSKLLCLFWRLLNVPVNLMSEVCLIKGARGAYTQRTTLEIVYGSVLRYQDWWYFCHMFCKLQQHNLMMLQNEVLLYVSCLGTVHVRYLDLETCFKSKHQLLTSKLLKLQVTAAIKVLILCFTWTKLNVGRMIQILITGQCLMK